MEIEARIIDQHDQVQRFLLKNPPQPEDPVDQGSNHGGTDQSHHVQLADALNQFDAGGLHAGSTDA